MLNIFSVGRAILKNPVTFIFLIQMLLFSDLVLSQTNDWQYFGENPPDSIPKVFGEGIISTKGLEHSSPVFTDDLKSFYWVAIRTDLGLRNREIYIAEFSDNKWIIGKMDFCKEGNNYDSPFLHKNKLLFISNQFADSATRNEKKHWMLKNDFKIYYVGISHREKIKLFLPDNIINKKIISPSFSENGNIYYVAYLDNVEQNCGIYRLRKITENKYIEEVLPPCINSEYQDWTPFIAPDESYILFSSTRGKDNNDYGDLYISFNQGNNNWSEPIGLGDKINTPAQERFPYISPDSKYLFFTRSTDNNSHDIFWVSADIIEKLKNDFRKSR